jgi:hypothetical protein
MFAGTDAPGAAVAAPGPVVNLQIAVGDGHGHRSAAHLRCRGSAAAATGYLRGHAAAACRRARALATFLASEPPPTRECTQIYGGPDAARVRGRIGSRAVDRRFARTDGCAIADWTRAGVLLPASRFAP